MTTPRVMQDNGQEAWIALCNKPTADGKTCDYIARSSENAAIAEKMLLDHQLLQPNGFEEIGLRPPADIKQHYPHFVGFDLPNAGQGLAALRAVSDAIASSATAPTGSPSAASSVQPDVQTTGATASSEATVEDDGPGVATEVDLTAPVAAAEGGESGQTES